MLFSFLDSFFTCGDFSSDFSPSLLKPQFSSTNNGKSFKCHYCAYSSPHIGNVRTHVKTHTGEKPYGCRFCFKRFTQKVHLERHVWTHTGEKPHECTQCNKKFNRIDNLKTHRRVHEGKKS